MVTFNTIPHTEDYTRHHKYPALCARHRTMLTAPGIIGTRQQAAAERRYTILISAKSFAKSGSFIRVEWTS